MRASTLFPWMPESAPDDDTPLKVWRKTSSKTVNLYLHLSCAETAEKLAQLEAIASSSRMALEQVLNAGVSLRGLDLGFKDYKTVPQSARHRSDQDQAGAGRPGLTSSTPAETARARSRPKATQNPAPPIGDADEQGDWDTSAGSGTGSSAGPGAALTEFRVGLRPCGTRGVGADATVEENRPDVRYSQSRTPCP